MTFEGLAQRDEVSFVEVREGAAKADCVPL
jgi:hypothetical protein